MRLATILILLIPAIVNAQTRPVTSTQPATRPITVGEAQALIEVAAAKLEKARADFRSRFEASPAYMSQKADVDAKAALLAQARQTGTQEEKLLAAEAFGIVNNRLKQLRVDALSREESVRSATYNLGAAQRYAEQLRRTEAIALEEEIIRDPIRNAIRNSKIRIGMTLEQVKSVIGPGQLIEQDGDERVYEWERRKDEDIIDGEPPLERTDGRYRLVCVFLNGKLERHARHSGPRR